mmetsp:Transcript_1506/g.3364  ORF Transcript_1506/g.3364 Transcript_1506/m.3364 type:complete len:81 (-) Transcript_1506:53-295(-)
MSIPSQLINTISISNIQNIKTQKQTKKNDKLVVVTNAYAKSAPINHTECPKNHIKWYYFVCLNFATFITRILRLLRRRRC